MNLIEFIGANWGELTLGLLALVKVVVNATPTEKDNEIFGTLDKIVNMLVEDKIKNPENK